MALNTNTAKNSRSKGTTVLFLCVINKQNQANISCENISPKPGGLTEGTLVFGDPITASSVIADIIRVYP